MGLFSFFRKRLPAASTTFEAQVLFFGLGNPGENYAATRHNIGFRIADSLSQHLKKPAPGSLPDAEYLSGLLFDSKKAIVVKPMTFMNRSGEAVSSLIRKSGCSAGNALVIVDDYNLPAGRLRARRGGSDGGHNGLKSIINAIGEDFPRLRVGIGPLPQGVPTIDFVLGAFTAAEEEKLRLIIPLAVEACLTFAHEGIESLMNKYNKSDIVTK